MRMIAFPVNIVRQPCSLPTIAIGNAQIIIVREKNAP